MSGHERRNRAFWDADAHDYQAVHGELLAAHPKAWGVWRIPESELAVLGDVVGADVLEFGCGAAQWSLALAHDGARMVGLDQSRAQLAHARALMREAGVEFPLLCASGESVPLASESFDVVFCDHGAMSFCDPERTVPEAARLLRAGGTFAFCVTHPLVYLTWDRKHEKQSKRLYMDYADLGCVDLGDGTVDWVTPPGRWIELFRTNGFEVETLLELSPPPDATTTYDEFIPTAWAQRWPGEQIWRARRR
jgi:SAM-dependent methyltransferase